MSVIYYPKSSVIYKRDTANGAYEQVELAVSPNTIIYFDTSSALQSVSSSIIYHTASSAVWAATASVLLGSIESSSFSAYAISSSNALTAAFALNGGGTGTILETGSLYPITSSWAEKVISASYAPYVDTNTWLTTGSLYPITASKAISSSFAPLDSIYSASVSTQIISKQSNLVTGNTYTITSSWANNTISASYAPGNNNGAMLTTGSTYPITASWATNVVNGSSGTIITTGSTYPVTASWATNVVNGSSGTILTTGSTYPITSSWSNNTISASYAPNSGGGITLSTGSLYPITSSRSISSSYAPIEPPVSSSLVSQLATKQPTLITGNVYTITSSWANASVSASYAPINPVSSASLSSQIENKQDLLVEGTAYNITTSLSNRAISASYAPYTDTNTWITTGSLYPITSSRSISSSYAPIDATFSSSLATQLSGKQATLVSTTIYNITSSIAISASYAPYVDTNTWLTTGSTYPITSSDSLKSISSSYSPINPFASSSLVSQLATKQPNLITGGTYIITSSVAISASYAPFTDTNTWLTTGSTYPITASNSLRSISSSYAPIDPFASASLVTQLSGKQLSLVTGSTYPITASWAIASVVFSSSVDQYMKFLPDGITTKGRIGFDSPSSSDLIIEQQSSSVGGVSIDVTGSRVIYVATDGTIQFTGSLKFSQPLTSSLAVTASYALNGGGGGATLTTGSTYPITASWAIASVAFSSSADQYIRFLPDGVTTKGKIGFSSPSSNDLIIEQQSSSVGGISINTSGSQKLYVTADGTIQFTGSLKFSQPLTASYISTSFSRGGTLYNNDGIDSTANIIVWQATSDCMVTNVKGYRVGGSAATINARKNGTDNHLASAISIGSENTWVDGGAVQNATYAMGDKLEIMIVTVTGGPTQLAVQVNFKK